MKTSTSLLIAAGAVIAVVGIGSTVYADSGWRGRGAGPCGESSMRGPMRGPMGGGFAGHRGGPDRGGPGRVGPDGGPFSGMMGPMVIKRVFELADTDEDGKLTQEEIDAARTKRFESHDTDNDGKLTLSEFEALFAEMTEPMTVRAFQFLDPDGDAVITKAEFEKPGAKLVERFDRNGDGVLSPDDRRPGFGPGEPRGRRHDGKRRGPWSDDKDN